MAYPSPHDAPRRHDGDRTRVLMYDYIVQYKVGHDGNTPSMVEVRTACHIASSSTVKYHLGRLEAAGQIRIISQPRQPLAIAIPGGGWSMCAAGTVETGVKR